MYPFFYLNYLMNHYIMDYETLSNCFVAVFNHYKTSDQKIFVVHKLQNDFEEFIEFLRKNQRDKEWHISYNGLAFDAQVTHYILEKYETLKHLTAEDITKAIYTYAQYCINKSNNREWQDYAPWDMKIVSRGESFESSLPRAAKNNNYSPGTYPYQNASKRTLISLLNKTDNELFSLKNTDDSQQWG